MNDLIFFETDIRVVLDPRISGLETLEIIRNNYYPNSVGVLPVENYAGFVALGHYNKEKKSSNLPINSPILPKLWTFLAVCYPKSFIENYWNLIPENCTVLFSNYDEEIVSHKILLDSRLCLAVYPKSSFEEYFPRFNSRNFSLECINRKDLYGIQSIS
jgi:hypothetical protein